MTQHESPGSPGDMSGTDPLQRASQSPEDTAQLRPSPQTSAPLNGLEGPLHGQGDPAVHGQEDLTQRILPLVDPLGRKQVNPSANTAVAYPHPGPCLSSPGETESPRPGQASPVGLSGASGDGSEDMLTAPSLADSIAAALQSNVTDLPTVSLPTSVSVASIEVLVMCPGISLVMYYGCHT